MALLETNSNVQNAGRRLSRSATHPFPLNWEPRIGQEMCKDCWKEWQQKQMQLINHFGLDVSNPDSHQFLFDNMKIFFYDEGWIWPRSTPRKKAA